MKSLDFFKDWDLLEPRGGNWQCVKASQIQAIFNCEIMRCPVRILRVTVTEKPSTKKPDATCCEINIRLVDGGGKPLDMAPQLIEMVKDDFAVSEDFKEDEHATLSTLGVYVLVHEKVLPAHYEGD